MFPQPHELSLKNLKAWIEYEIEHNGDAKNIKAYEEIVRFLESSRDKIGNEFEKILQE